MFGGLGVRNLHRRSACGSFSWRENTCIFGGVHPPKSRPSGPAAQVSNPQVELRSFPWSVRSPCVPTTRWPCPAQCHLSRFCVLPAGFFFLEHLCFSLLPGLWVLIVWDPVKILSFLRHFCLALSITRNSWSSHPHNRAHNLYYPFITLKLSECLSPPWRAPLQARGHVSVLLCSSQQSARAGYTKEVTVFSEWVNHRWLSCFECIC